MAARTGVAKTYVGEILTNPIYAGHPRTGEPAGIPALIEPALWSAVQTARERRRTREPGRILKRGYALRLRCSGCGRSLYGDVGPYRHPGPTCLPFRAATPVDLRRRSGEPDRRTKGHSYPQVWYEGAVAAILDRIGRVDDLAITEVVRLHGEYEPRADGLSLARIKRAREDASRRLAETRDVEAWQAAMTRLYAEEADVRQPTDKVRLTPPEIVDYLRSLPRL